jgi:phospholipid/cholesterol/gamma-HCH transport system permease protein
LSKPPPHCCRTSIIPHAELADRAELALNQERSTLVVRLAGTWSLHADPPTATAVVQALEASPSVRQVAFDTATVTEWDSGLLTFLVRVIEECRRRGISAEREGLPEGVRSLLSLAEAVPEKKDAKTQELETPFLDRIGLLTMSAQTSVKDVLGFLGETTLAFVKLLSGKARFRKTDLGILIQQAGVEALSIVTLVSFLLGLILAFVGAVQLQTFGATIYVADLVGIAMVRDMAALITAIVMAGRSGAAYAAQLGSMKVTQEIDALTTMALSPIEFLVLPRVLALVLMMPLLVLYADFVGILGGLAVGTTMLDIS